MSDVVVGAKLEADASGAINSVKNFKQELRLAQQEVVILSEKFGATSKEAAAAAKKAAELKDKIGDAAQLVDAFNPDTKFRAFGASIQTVVGGFTALTGAMGLLGVESEEVQKTLLKVQSALALSQGISQLQEGIQSIKNLGSVLVNTLGKSGLIGIAIAGVAALGAALFGVFKKNQDLIDAQKEYNKVLSSATVEVNKVRIAFQQAKDGLITKDEALKQYNATIGNTVGHAKDLNQAEKLMAENAKAYIDSQALKAKANFFLQKSVELSTNAELFRVRVQQEKLLPFIRREIEQQLKRDEELAKKYLDMASALSGQASGLSKGFAGPTITPAAGGKATTPGGKAKEKEQEEIGWITKQLAQMEEDAFRESIRLKDIHATKAAAIDQSRFTKSTALQEATTAAAKNNALARMALEDAEKEATLARLQAVSGALSALADLVGRQTAAGKALSVASAVINTYVGVTKALSAAPPPINFINAAAVLFSGLAAVKNILSVKVPGGGGNVPGSGSVSAPLQAQLPQSTNTRLDRDQLNQIGNAASRAFVVEADVTNNQERIRRLNRAARI